MPLPLCCVCTGKIVANLELSKQWSGVTNVAVVDGLADEGHRIGAYILLQGSHSACFAHCIGALF